MAVMRQWTLATGLESCGYCRRGIATGEPMLVMRLAGGAIAARKVRCEAHAGAPVDWTEIDHERWARENEARREAENRPDPPRLKEPAPVPERALPGILPLSAIGRAVFDPKQAQTGERE